MRDVVVAYFKASVKEAMKISVKNTDNAEISLNTLQE
jgi:hypothetical protein